MKKILYLTQTFPYPPTSGGTIKSFNTIKTLSQKYQVFVCSVTDRKPTTFDQKVLKKLNVSFSFIYSSQIAQPVQNHLPHLVRQYLKGIPHHLFQYSHPKVKPAINKVIAAFKPDIIHVDHLNMAQYLPSLKQQTWILEHHNLESDLLWSRFLYTPKLKRKMYLLVESLLTRVWEYIYLPKFDHIFTIADDDTQFLKNRHALSNVSTQTLVYTPAVKKPLARKKQHIILFIGGLNWPPNEDAVGWFIRKVWPEVISRIPSVEFHVVGHDQPYFRRQLGKQPNVIFHGYLDDVGTWLKKASAFVLPFRMGGGVRLKALTALSYGVPLVSNHLGIRGLGLKDKKNVLLVESPSSMATAICELLLDSKKSAKLTMAGLHYLSLNHGEKNNKDFLEQYSKITEQSQ